jgi:hypothetical protein
MAGEGRRNWWWGEREGGSAPAQWVSSAEQWKPQLQHRLNCQASSCSSTMTSRPMISPAPYLDAMRNDILR